MRTFLIAVALIAAITNSQAQDVSGMGGGGFGGRHRQQQKNAKTPTQKPKVDDKAYNAALKQLPDKPYDPWLECID
jgi:hypothetical protein